MSTAELIARASAWAGQDPDEHTRLQLEAVIAAAQADEAAAIAELESAFGERLTFGTAGIRGTLGPGPSRMNLVLVRQTAAGLAAYLRGRGGGAVVIGFDARHNSEHFARTIAAVLDGAGQHAMVLSHPTPTPVLAYAIRELGCAAGVMVTASHNPPQDNGVKVYLEDGAQIVPPADQEISGFIDHFAAKPLDEIPLGDDWETLDDSIIEEYIQRVAELALEPPPTPARVVYTPMHGVGGRVFEAVVDLAGYPLPIPVAEQFDPNPDFPTVAFPNPEEPGAMDLALRTAQEHDADIVIANDPDADRCAVAVRDRDGTWCLLTGDEVGSLLGWWLTQRGTDEGVFAQSIVSGTMLQTIAEAFELGYVQTLTGFKWIARVPDLVYGYEEALGYCIDPEAVNDKDGISAALLIIEIASYLKERQRTMLDALDDLEREYGVHLTEQVSLRVQELAQIDAIMTALREQPPTEVDGRAVVQFDDLLTPTDDLPPTDGLRFIIDGGARVIIRPSGTEPKLKAYLQVIAPVGDEDLAAARDAATARMAGLRDAVNAWFA